MDVPSEELLRKYELGDLAAARQIHDRYAERLIAVARRLLSDKLAARIDPEDVVQSAYRSFFLRARDGQYVVRESGDLWRLLIAITRHCHLSFVICHLSFVRRKGLGMVVVSMRCPMSGES
jgi:RNA polymerase sigma-70 factor (ECF subfamily)